MNRLGNEYSVALLYQVINRADDRVVFGYAAYREETNTRCEPSHRRSIRHLDITDAHSIPIKQAAYHAD
jgi:hypothetical protein